jgi:signal transduction histidine kinase
LLLASLGVCFPKQTAAGEVRPRGLPFIRTYPLDEIGSVPRGLRLGFDSFDRFAVMYDGIYSVLNDSVWVNRIDRTAVNRTLMTTIRVGDGNYFYGGRGSWGLAELTDEGLFRARPFVPPDAPAWTKVTPFNDVLVTRTGVYFYELNGVVYWSFAQRRNFFFELPRVSSVFLFNDRVFVSCQDQVLREIHAEAGSVEKIAPAGLDGTVIERSAMLDASHILLVLRDGRLVAFDGKTAIPWTPQIRYGFTGRISALTSLVDGGVALAITGEGLFLISAEGSLRWRLPLTEFQRISEMTANEAGVLWVLGENAVRKIFYNSSLTNFDQQLGLTAAWPRIASLNGHLIVRSDSRLYNMDVAGSGTPSRFEPLEWAPEGGASYIASQGSQLLVGNATGVYAAGPDHRFVRVLQIENVASLEFIEPDVCVVIGTREIAAIHYRDGSWTECAARIAGVGDAPIRSTAHGAVWVEMGGDHVGRLTYRKDHLDFQPISLPWTGASWTNIGAVGNIIILSGAPGQRAFYDEARERFCAAPELARMLDRSPYWITRVTEDKTGTLWATHMQGVVTFTPKNGDYVVDATTFELHNDSYPIVILTDNDTWVTTGRALYHIEQSASPQNRPHVTLVSLAVDHFDRKLVHQARPSDPALSFAADDNSLSFRLFSGTYAWRHPPVYEYRLSEAEPWTRVDPGLLLRFPKLREGSYRLEVRPVVPEIAKSAPLAFGFVINPPWYLTPGAYAAYSVVLVFLIVTVVRLSNRRSRQRNDALERLVEQRTGELHVAMEKLNEETRNTATIAERSRLAGEIHDSLQQGLSGSILQLDTTMTSASISPEVRTRLNVVRGMLSYTREEIQHSVLNLGSPLLQNSNLGDALGKLVGFIHAGTIRISVSVPEKAISLEAGLQHNLLRIAQEAITNAVKHANATHIEVALRQEDQAVSLLIADDGIGFDPALRANVEGHFGLRGMRARARSIKADLHVVSSPGAGTTIRVNAPQFPLSHDPNSQN